MNQHRIPLKSFEHDMYGLEIYRIYTMNLLILTWYCLCILDYQLTESNYAPDVNVVIVKVMLDTSR